MARTIRVLACCVLGTLLLAALGSCRPTGEMGSAEGPQPSEVIPKPLEDYLPQDACSEPAFFEFDLAAASRAPRMPEIDPTTPPELGWLGEQGAAELAQGLAPSGAFCSYPVSDRATTAIAQAMSLVEQGQHEQARRVLAEWLADLGALHPAKIAAPARSGEASRQAIRDLLNAAAADQAAGGDGAAYTSQANQSFRDLFAGEIGEAGFGDSLRLAEEAYRMGESQLGDTAMKRAMRIWEEKLQTDIEDFDPCTASKEAVRDLLNSLAQAMLLGIPGSYEGEGQYYQTVWKQAQAASQQLFNQAAVKAGLPELASAIPECTPGGEIEVRQTLPMAEKACVNVIPFTLAWQGSQAHLEGSGPAECSHVEENLGGSQVAMHQIHHLEMAFTGTASAGTPGSLNVTLTVGGEIIEFYSNFPPESPQVFTEDSPFQVPAEGSFPLEFEFREGATAEIRNQEGQEAFVFVLHLSGR